MTDIAPVLPTIDDEDEEASYIDFRKTGGVHLVIDGQKRRLRSPRMRDYKHLYQLWSDEAEALDARSIELQEFMLEVMGRGDERAARGEPRITDEEKAKDRHLAQAIRQATEQAALSWWVETVRTLGVSDSDKAIEADDLPVFLTNSESINAMLDHWRSVPSRSGAR